METLKLFATSLLSFLAIDFIWLRFIANKFYLEQLGPIGRIQDGRFQIVLWAGMLVYVLMSVGLVVFVLPKFTNYATAFLYGALFGWIVYGVYDWTNFATLRDWTILLACTDMLWGGILSGLVSMILYFMVRKF